MKFKFQCLQMNFNWNVARLICNYFCTIRAEESGCYRDCMTYQA